MSYNGQAQRKNQRFSEQKKKKDVAPVNLEPMQLPDDYVQAAEDVMNPRPNITTSKIRSILSLVSAVYNVENVRTEETLLPDSKEKIQMMRIRILYEAGRDENVKEFVIKSHLINYIKDIGDSRKKFIRFAKYMEALVAYHRYFGGKE